jgi:hypothetical protein
VNESYDLVERPDVIRYARRHGRRGLDGLVNAARVVVHEAKRDAVLEAKLKALFERVAALEPGN